MHILRFELSSSGVRALFVFIALLLTASQPSSASDDTLDVAIYFKHASLDPIYTTTNGELYAVAPLVDTLVTVTQNGERTSGLAKSWAQSEDGHTYTFSLRDDIFWSDGEPIIADDFVTTFRRMHDTSLDLHSKTTYMTSHIKNSQSVLKGEKPLETLGVEATDDKTLKFTLDAPIPFFPSILQYMSFAPTPSHKLAELGEKWADPEHYVSSGAYVIDGVDEQGGLSFTINPYYYDRDALYFPRIKHHINDSFEKVFRDLVVGKLDAAQRYPGTQLDQVSSTPGDQAVSRFPDAPLAQTVYVAFNMQDPLVGDVNIRKALSMALDRDRVAELFYSAPAYSLSSSAPNSDWNPLPPSWGALSDTERLEAARARMKKAGYSPFERMKLTLSVNDTARERRLAKELQTSWDDIWVDVRVVFAPSREHYANLRAGDYQVARAAWGPDYPDPATFLNILHPESPKNYAGWRNDEYQRIIDLLNTKSMSTEERKQEYLKLEKLIQEEVPIAPVFYVRSHSLYSSRLHFPERLPGAAGLSPSMMKYLRPRPAD